MPPFNVTCVFPPMRSAIPNFLSVALCFILNSFAICECISKHYVCLVLPVLKFYTNGIILCLSFCYLFLSLLHPSLCFRDTFMLVREPVVHLFLLLVNFCCVTVRYCVHPFLLLQTSVFLPVFCYDKQCCCEHVSQCSVQEFL